MQSHGRPAADPPAAAAIETARELLLHDDAPAAIRLLSDRRFDDPALHRQRLLLLGSAYARVGEYAAADEYFDSVETLAHEAHDADVLTDLALRRGRRYAFAHELDKAWQQQHLAMQSQSPLRTIEALHLESFLYGLERRYAMQAATLQRMLQRIDPADERLAAHAAYGTFTLAVLARELCLPDAAPILEPHLQASSWPPQFNLQRFQALKALGWTCALHGDYFTAFRYLKKSSAYAPSPAWEAIAALDRAYLARCLNEARWSRQELHEAEELAETVDWRSARNEERVGLLLFAELFAAVDVGRAAQYMATFRDLGEFHAPLLSFGHDDRLQAQADYSAGVTQIALGNVKAGIKLFQQSFAVYEGIGYDWRAGRCALRLFEATNKADYLQIAREKLQRYSQSWLGDQVRKHAGITSALPPLPPMQQRVFEELCRGLSTAQIASNLGRSEYTIKNHIKLIFKAFGVKSRAALIAKVSGRSR